MKLKIISGGQTGADMGGLLAARDLGIVTGGWAPKGWLTENGPRESLLRSFGLVCAGSGYAIRTKLNVRDSDITILFSREKDSQGTRVTALACGDWRKNFLLVNPFSTFCEHGVEEFILRNKKPEQVTINVAGNRESVSPGTQEKVREVLFNVLSRIQ